MERDGRRDQAAGEARATGDEALAPGANVAGATPRSMLGAAMASLGPGVLQRKLARRLAQRDAAAGAVQRAPAAKGPARPAKKSATPDEVKAIQRLIDQAIQVEQRALQLEAEVKALRAAHDAAATQKDRDASALRRQAGGLKQQAINLAVASYGIDITHVKKLLYASDNTDGDSETDDAGNVTIGDSAFMDPAWLASSIAHEAEIHAGQQAARGRQYEGPQGRRLNELQGYDHEIGEARRFGLTAAQVKMLRTMRQHYLDGLDDAHKARRQRGDYTMEPGHEDE